MVNARRAALLLLLGAAMALMACSGGAENPPVTMVTQESTFTAAIVPSATATPAPPTRTPTGEPTRTPTPDPTATQASTATPVPATSAPTPTPGTPETGATRIWSADGAVMVYVPAGPFLMGSTPDNPEADNVEYPQREVTLSAFWIDQTEVTNSRYAQCVTEGGCRAPRHETSFTRAHYYDDPDFADYPVVLVDWHDAVRYCEWSGKRLPTEAEWEKAARGTDGRDYPWGTEAPNHGLANYEERVGDTSAVGNYPEGASPYGVLDMSGNVWEWGADWYDPFYYQQSIKRNPKGPGRGQERVMRGGSWLHVARRVRAPLRASRPPGHKSEDLGFRCASSR